MTRYDSAPDDDRYDPPVPGFHDPNRVSLRKAVRATLVVPGVFAVFVATGNSTAALFGSFGSFAALVFADFGGPLRRRFRAYLLLAVIGGGLAAVGTAFADSTWPALAVTLFVVFAVAFSGALGGYFAAGGTAATLAFVLAVMTPGLDSDLASRELGWVFGVVVAGIVAVLVWPVHQRDRVRVAAAAVLREAADCLTDPGARRDLTALRAADATLTARAGVVYRPAGSIARERALVALVIVARRLLPLVDAVTAADCSAAADTTPEYGALAVQVAASLAGSARIVARERGEPVALEPLVDARAAHTDALERWAALVLPTDGGARVVDGVIAAFPLRRLSLSALEAAKDVDDAAHDDVRTRAEGRAIVVHAWEMLRAHCNLRSVRFRNAARAGIGLALAVLVAKTASVEHSFWVVLGALAVLRSSALGTGATAVQALAGALAGFGIASLVMATIGPDETWLWVALPVVVFLAAYTPGAVNFVVGQAGFTVFVVVMFNVLVPEGWRTGLVRVQDVAIGAGISVVVGALFWPRGARGVARRSFAELLRAASAHLSLAIDVAMRGGAGDVTAAAADVAGARARAVAALEDLALEHGGGHVDREGWGALLVDALLVELAGEGIERGRARHGTGPCTDAVDALAREGDEVAASVGRQADAIERDRERAFADGVRPSVPVSPELVHCLERHRVDDLDGALGLVWAHEWLMLVADHPG